MWPVEPIQSPSLTYEYRNGPILQLALMCMTTELVERMIEEDVMYVTHSRSLRYLNSEM